jgi:hypothetical protein
LTLFTVLKCPDIVAVIKVGRLELIGCVVKIDAESRVTKLLEDKPGEGRKNEDID